MKKDVSWKEFFADDERYADIINGIGCNGKQIVKKEDLKNLDTQISYSNKGNYIRKNRMKKKIKIRDCIRKVAFGTNFAIIGIENQEEVDYALPVRSMSYDLGTYETQLTDIRKQVRENSKGTAGNGGRL